MTDRDQNLANADALLAACDGDAGIYDRIRASLAKAIPQEFTNARGHLERADLPALRESAHKLHGMIATASSTVANVASALEDHAEAGSLAACTADMTALEDLVPRLLDELATLSFDRITA